MEKKDKSPFMVALGMRVLEQRKKLDLTQEQAAEKAGLTAQFLSFIESGKKSLRAENIVNLSKALEISTDYLLTGVCNDSDVDRVYQLLKSLDSQELLSAEIFFRKLKTACHYTQENKKDENLS